MNAQLDYYEPQVNDQEAVQAFTEKVMGDSTAALVTVMCSIGDKLGLFKDLYSNGPANAHDFAKRTKINERYSKEWLSAMTAAGYLSYDTADKTFSLPNEHYPALAQENGPFFFGGVFQMMLGMLSTYDILINAFRKGGGVPQSAYNDDVWVGMERFTGSWFENLLIPVWLPAMPDVKEKLERGAKLADVGCGRGKAIIKLAKEFPNSTFAGYDAFEPLIPQAKENAKKAGLSERVKFQHLDASKGIPGKYDIITTFDVIHDAVDPVGLLREIRKALNPGGIYICLEMKASDKLEENINPIGTMLYSVSILYCMTTSLAGNGAALGTCGMHEANVNKLGREAGFNRITKIELDNPFNNIFELRA